MRFDIITLFPEMFESFMASGVTRRAFDSGQVQVRLWNPRDQATGNYRRVDDRPFGGGPGMVMMAEPLWLCLQAIRLDRQQDQAPNPSQPGHRSSIGEAQAWPANNAAYRAKSTLPPLTMTPTRWPWQAGASCMRAASERQPVGSTTIFMRSA